MYIWDYFEGYPHKLVGEYDRENSIDRFIFKSGDRLDLKEKPIVFIEGTKEEILKYDDIENNGGAWLKIVSPKLVSTLEEYAKDDIEFIDVILRTANGDITDYKIVHILNKVEALNEAESIFSYITGSNNSAIRGFRKLRLYDDKLKNNIALLSEYSSFILISNVLKEKIENFRGVAVFKDKEMVF
ncbi:hypothetical protein CRV02_12250 [Arcobacter sp. CECT 8989]|uniref:imm11 family protein n=1 Tax=Arcobacter sp. CECT 8989 TaxID=2044509 RepID=UPI00100AD7D7|nr:DUF1629 domain-containing protein [Arcobacter sp. CECT 8989]RXJ98962.1 hypothetical protein CRV02_12250 [Arcobacter sp. CECT 8989]